MSGANRRTAVRRFCRHRLAVGCLVILVALIVMAVLAPWIVKQANLDSAGGLTPEALAQNPGAALFAVYVAAIFALAVAGLIVLLRHRKKFTLQPAAEELPRGAGFKTSCLNAGVLLFALVCVGLFVFSLTM